MISNDDAEYVFNEWHAATKSSDPERLLELYSEDATLETPMAMILLGVRGELKGRDAIGNFLRANFAHRGSLSLDFNRAKFHRESYQFDGRTLFWEYKRETPDGDSYEVAEVLDLRGRLIDSHRMYFGWFLLRDLIGGAEQPTELAERLRSAT